MKVINIISDTNIGGAGKCVINYANNSQDDNIDLYIVVPKGSLLLSRFNKEVKVIEIDGLYDKSVDIKAVPKLIKIFKSIHPDIVHTHSVLIARIVAKLFLKCKIIYTRHAYYDLEKKDHNFFRRKLYYLVDKTLADRIIIVTEALRQNLKDRGSIPDKMTTIVNGVPSINILSANKKREIRNRYGIKENDFVVSIIARLTNVKGHETFLKIAYMFKKNNIKNIKFLIVGEGELSNKINDMIAELGLEDIVIVTGFINDISEILNITSLQVNCSIGAEATSLSILEGYSIGIPIVASSYGGNPYIVKSEINGYIVPTKDVNSYYEKINMIKNDNQLYKRLSNGAKKEYQNKYTIDKYVKEINKCYYDVISR